MSDLEQIVDGVEPETEAPEVVEAAPEEVVADAPEVTEEPETQPEPKAEPTVPLAALLEVRQELRDLKTLAAPKAAPTPPPDVFEDPQGFSQHMQRQLEAATTSQKLEMSKFMAEREFGAEQVQAMYDYFEQHPDQSQAFRNSPSPYHAGMEHYNKHRVAQEIGSDPAAYREKLEAEIRTKLEAEMVAKQARDNAGKFAPSMANATGTGGGPKSNWTGPADLTSILGE